MDWMNEKQSKVVMLILFGIISIGGALILRIYILSRTSNDPIQQIQALNLLDILFWVIIVSIFNLILVVSLLYIANKGKNSQ